MLQVQSEGVTGPVKLARLNWAFRRAEFVVLVIGIAGVLCVGNVAAATTPSERSGGTIHIYSVGSASSNSQTVAITGAFADAGSFTVTGSTSKVQLSRGIITINLAKGIAAENKLFSHIGRFVSQTTCGINTSYTAPVTFVSGTGAYAGISGAVTLKTAEIGVFPKLANGKCDLSENAQPIGFLSLGQGSGSVQFKST